MASIDNLNFGIILDDKDFKKQIAADIKLAKDFNIQLSDALDIRRSGMGDAPKLLRQYQQRLDELMKSGRKLNEEQRQERENLKQLIRLYQRQVINISNAEARQQRYARSVRETTQEMDRQSRYMSQIANMVKTATSAYAAKEIIGDMIRITGEFEKHRVALRSILQDMTGADALYEKIQALAVESPFQFKDLISYTKQLAAFSVPLDELYDTTKMLADVSAGLGVGMDRLILAYGQIRSAAFLRGTEVRQLTEAGVPILEELRKKFEELGETGITVADVFDKISARMVPFEMVKEVFEDMTSAGGMFYQMQEVQAQTLAGKISNLKDAYEVMFAEIGGKNERFLKNSVDLVRRLIENYENVGREIVALIGTYGLYRAALYVATYNTTLLARANVSLLSTLKKVTAALLSNPYALIAAAITSVGYAIYKVVTYESDFEKMMNSVKDVYNEFWAAVQMQQSSAEVLFKRLEMLTAGTEEYEKVRSEILRTYGTYLDEQDKEAIKTGELAGVYDRLAESIRAANAEKFKQQAESVMNETIAASIEDAKKKLDEFFEYRDITDTDIKAKLTQYVLGLNDDIDIEQLSKDIYENDKGLSRFKSNAITDVRSYVTYQINDIKSLFDEAEESAKAAREYIDKVFDVPAKKGGGEKAVLAPWQKELQGFLEGIGKNAKYPWWSDEKKNSDWDKYVADIRGKYDEINKQIEDSNRFQDARVEGLKEERAELEKIAQFLGFDINPQSGGSGTESDQLRRWRIQVQWLQELQKQYQALSQYADNATLSPLFMGRYGEDISSTLSFLPEERRMSILVDFDFEDNLLYMASEIRKVGTDAALALAEQIERSLGRDWASVQEGLFKAVKDYADFIKEWGGQDFMLDGKGVAFDLSKIANDYNNAIAKVGKTRDEAIRKAAEAAKKNGEEWYNQQLMYITALYGSQMEYERKLRQEKIREKGEEYAKELIEKNPAILTEDFNDASFRQLRDSLRAIDGLMKQAESNDLISDETKKKLTDAGLSLEDFEEAMNAYIEGVEKKNLSEIFEKVVDTASTALNTINDLGGSIAQLGSSIDDAGLERLGEALQQASQYTSSILQGFAQGGLAGGLVSLITSMIDALVSGISRAAEYQKRLNDAAKEYQETIRELAREDYDSIFGTDELGRFMNDLREAGRYVDDYRKSLGKATADSYSNWGNGSLGKRHSAIDTLANVSGMSGSDFYNDGVLDMEKVRAYFEQVGDEIPKKQRKVIEELIENYDYMNEQMGFMDEYLSSLFGDLSSSIADVWMENWKNMTDTAKDEAQRMKDIFYDLGESIVQSMVQSLIINTVLSKYTDQLKALYQQYNETGDMDAFQIGLSQLFENLQTDLSNLQPVVEEIYNEAEDRDLINRDDYNSVDTIQGNLSEETLNRVLNLVNAMRAEQFRQGMRIDNIDTTLMSVAGLLGESRDQYLNYLAQISANTANTADRMQQWLDRWDDSTSGEGRSGSLRVRIVS